MSKTKQICVTLISFALAAIIVFLMIRGLANLVKQPSPMIPTSTTEGIAYSNAVDKVRQRLDEMREELYTTYFRLGVSDGILRNLGVTITMNQSNGVRPWIEVCSPAITNVLRVEVPDWKREIAERAKVK